MGKRKPYNPQPRPKSWALGYTGGVGVGSAKMSDNPIIRLKQYTKGWRHKGESKSEFWSRLRRLF